MVTAKAQIGIVHGKKHGQDHGHCREPKERWNTELIVRETLSAIESEGAETEPVSVVGKTIKLCDSCRTCRETKRCHIQDDDLPPIFEKILKADGIIMASPVYFGSATPEIKALIDRAD